MWHIREGSVLFECKSNKLWVVFNRLWQIRSGFCNFLENLWQVFDKKHQLPFNMLPLKYLELFKLDLRTFCRYLGTNFNSDGFAFCRILFSHFFCCCFVFRLFSNAILLKIIKARLWCVKNSDKFYICCLLTCWVCCSLESCFFIEGIS